jgi:predicted DNA-binding transcriptional regulator AlpA
MDETNRDQVTFEWGQQAPGKAPGRPVRAPARLAKVSQGPAASQGASEAPSPSALPPDNELWDVHAAARFLKRSVSWVYHKAEDGTLPVRRLGGWGIRFIPGELRAWVESGGARRSGR